MASGKIFRMSEDDELSEGRLMNFIAQNDRIAAVRYYKLKEAYENKYQIHRMKKKPDWKPDNRLSVNFAKYITDTFEGFFLGNPIKENSDDKAVNDYVNYFKAYNIQDDGNAELSKLASIYGRGYEMYYVDDYGEVATATLSPIDAFMVYNEGIKPRPLFFCRTYTDSNNIRRGSISDSYGVRYFNMRSGLSFEDDWIPHGFDRVPALELVQNEERIGIFEHVLELINAYNKAISEKANDVDYFADAYLKILGAKLNNSDIQYIRDKRIINFEGGDLSNIVVEFMQKPSGDETQEHLLDRIERLIFTTSMVANINDDNFATSSGIALRYKLKSMTDLAKTKERKFAALLRKRYRLVFSNPVVEVGADKWTDIRFHFSLNFPNNLLEEAQVASELAGTTSRKTQLSVLSVVDDVDAEIDRIKEENDSMADPEPLQYELSRNGLQDTGADDGADD